jgi:hypothetical protein
LPDFHTAGRGRLHSRPVDSLEGRATLNVGDVSFRFVIAGVCPLPDLYEQCILTPYPSRESDVVYMLRALL